MIDRAGRKRLVEGERTWRGTGWRLVVLLATAGWACVGTAARATEPRRWQTAVLEEHGISVTPESLLEHLGKWDVSRDQQREAEQLTAQLGSPSFDERERASEQLLQMRPPALGALRQAVQSSDLEIAHRARYLLEQLSDTAEIGEQKIVLRALLRESAERRIAGVTPLALAILPTLDEPTVFRFAQEAAWHCVRNDDLPAVKAALDSENLPKRSAALVAYERLLRKAGERELVARLAAPSAEERLAACRAVLPYQPRACLPVLVEFIAQEESEYAAEAAKLLQAATGKQPNTTSSISLAAAWQTAVAELGADAKLSSVSDRDRLWWGSGRDFVEDFDLTAEIKQKYGPWRYRSTLVAGAKAAGGMLRLDGQHDEGDQWLEIDPLNALGQPEFGRRLRVAARLGGEAEGSGAYHVGVVVGNLKVALHPGYEGTGLRIERDDDHEYLSETEDIGITLGGNELFDVTLELNQKEDLSTALSVTIRPVSQPAQKVQKTYAVRPKDIGKISRVAFVRSGRTGGAGKFDRLQISPLP